MKKLSFKTQMYISLAVLAFLLVLGGLLHMGFLHNIAYIIVGLLFLINPVWPRFLERNDPAKLKKGVRIGSALVIVIFGFLTRFIV